MDKLLVTKPTRKLLDAYMSHPTHALILRGLQGTGLRTIANRLAKQLSPVTQRIISIEPDKGLISIDRVRQLYQQTKTIHHKPLVVVIDDADTLSNDAQNSLLKLFEEPVKNVYFILTTHHGELLLSTIMSRAQVIDVPPISRTDSHQLLNSRDIPQGRLVQMLFLAPGLPAELIRLMDNSEYFATQSELVKDARNIIQLPLYERLKLLKKYQDREGALQLVIMMGRLLSLNLVKQKNYRVSDILESVMHCGERIRANGHVKTQLLALMTKLN